MIRQSVILCYIIALFLQQRTKSLPEGIYSNSVQKENTVDHE